MYKHRAEHDYDRESEYWQDIQDAQQAQIEAQKNLPSVAAFGKNEKNLLNDSGILPHKTEVTQSET